MVNYQGNFPDQHTPPPRPPYQPGQYPGPQNLSGLSAVAKTLIAVAVILVVIVGSIIGYVQVKHYNKVNSMIETAERIIPESDWVEDGGNNKPHVSGSPTCIPFDQDCYTLHRGWEATEPVDIEKMADQLGIPMEHTQYPADCMRSTEDGGRIEICAYLSERAVPGKWLISYRDRQR